MIAFFMPSPSFKIVKFQQALIQWFFLKDRCHILVDLTSDIATGDRPVIKHIVGDPHDMDVGMIFFLVHHHAGHAEGSLAGDIVVDHDDIAVKLLCIIPEFQHMLPAACEVATHDAVLMVLRHTEKRIVHVGCIDDDIALHIKHLRYGQNAPAVVHPVGLVQVVASGTAPEQGPVPGLRETVDLIFIGFFRNLKGFSISVYNIRKLPSGESVGEHVNEHVGGNAIGRIWGSETVKLLRCADPSFS